MEELLTKISQTDWSVSEDIDWNKPIRLPFWIRRKTYIKVVSQFFHAEIVSQHVCRRLLAEIRDEEVRRFLEFQLRDERKHMRIYEEYLSRVGGIAPIEPEMAEALDRTLAWSGPPVALIAAFHVIFEGGALAILEKLIRNFPCPLFQEINRRIMPDEALHVAFGLRYVRQELAALPDVEKARMYDWMHKIWEDCALAVRKRQTLPIRLATSLRPDWPDRSWDRQRALLRRMGFETRAESV